MKLLTYILIAVISIIIGAKFASRTVDPIMVSSEFKPPTSIMEKFKFAVDAVGQNGDWLIKGLGEPKTRTKSGRFDLWVWEVENLATGRESIIFSSLLDNKVLGYGIEWLPYSEEKRNQFGNYGRRPKLFFKEIFGEGLEVLDDSFAVDSGDVYDFYSGNNNSTAIRGFGRFRDLSVRLIIRSAAPPIDDKRYPNPLKSGRYAEYQLDPELGWNAVFFMTIDGIYSGPSVKHPLSDDFM